jgi:integrase
MAVYLWHWPSGRGKEHCELEMNRKPQFGCIFRRKKKLSDGSKVELGHWWIKYSVGGQIFRESSKSEKYGEAERLLKTRIGEMVTGTFHGVQVEKTTVEQLLDDVLLDYQTNGKAERFALAAIEHHLRPYFRGRRVMAVSTEAVKKYIAFRRSADQGTWEYRGRLKKPKPKAIQPASNATINRELALLKHAFYLGWRGTPRKVASVPYIPMLEEHNVRKGFFEHEQFLAMRAALPEYLRPVLTFAYYTGCRRGEILALQWSQVDLTERVVRLEPGTTKNEEARHLPLTAELYETLVMQQSIRDTRFLACPWVFFTEAGGKIGRFQRSWKTACVAAGLATGEGEPDRLFHDLRRSGVRNLIRAGVPESVAMRISGHKTRSVFERYNIVSERDLHDAARKLETYLSGKANPTQSGHTLGTPKQDSADLSGNVSAKLLN